MSEHLSVRRVLVCILAATLLFISAPKAKAQVMEIGTNAIGLATLSPNLSIDFGFAKHWSAGVSGIVNPWKFKNDLVTKYWAVEPELKWWPRHQFIGHAIGVHATAGGYNFGMTKYRYVGNIYGCGVTYTYSLMIHERVNLEGVVGVGYARLDHKNVFDRHDEYSCYGPRTKDVFGPTKLGIRVTYILF